ncbi:amidohydrolase [Microbacterium mangrovi]|uniref:Amidohydrolase n=1 Tax=Microbacterium mangrovi TaxID=1348253 RepID=A0A0B2A7S5_9MICO|nr:amidohydrolase [Microbacterium mangrovi]KHK99569.1 amidohydrolase [Microbacterium mangrovi]
MATADVIFTGGAIFTGSGEPISGYAVAVTGDRITALISASEIDLYRGAETRIVDLDGALLSPGFQDAHIHPTSGGVELLQCDLSASEDAADAVGRISAYAAANPEVEWISGGGWSMDHYPGGNPLASLIDAVVPDRPVTVMSRDHHSLWANTAAIRAAGIDASTPDPEDGVIVRDADGNPTGTFHEGAGELFAAHRPAPDADLVYQGLLRAQDEMLKLGITGWQDAMIGTGAGMADALDAYLRALDEGALKVHVVGAQWWERSGGIEQVDAMVARREKVAARGAEKLTLGTTKIMVDGVAENQTAAMLDPYRDGHGHVTDNAGLSFIDPEALKQYVTALDAAGQQVHFHALGDRAVREALDALEAARAANGPTDGRHHLAHLQIVDLADVARFAELDATANLQSLWATHEDQLDELSLPFMKDGAVMRQYPFGDFVRAGVRLCSGSDWPVSSADPIAAIHIAVNRAVPGSDREPLGGEGQKLDLATVFASYTSGTARINHRDHDTGRIRPGYLANLAVISPNPFELAPGDIHTATVQSTWIDGEPVYVRPELVGAAAER